MYKWLCGIDFVMNDGDVKVFKSGTPTPKYYTPYNEYYQ